MSNFHFTLIQPCVTSYQTIKMFLKQRQQQLKYNAFNLHAELVADLKILVLITQSN